MHEELQALEHNHTWTIVPLLLGDKSISWKWTYKFKHNQDDTKHDWLRRAIHNRN